MNIRHSIISAAFTGFVFLMGAKVQAQYHEAPSTFKGMTNQVGQTPSKDVVTGRRLGTVNGGVVNTGRSVAETQELVMPLTQSQIEQDRILIQRIQTAISSDKTLSLAARNVNVFTDAGNVTLSGVVNTEREKNVIFMKTREVVGVSSVYDQVDVARR